jgi:cytochrome c5
MRQLRVSRIALFVLFAASPWAAALAEPSNEGAAVFEKSCKGCHGGGIGGFMSGAPKSGSEALKARLARAGSVEALVANTSRGVGKMRAQGGSGGLTDPEIRAAIDWMLAHPP